MVAALKPHNPYLGAGALSVTYLGYFFLCEALWSRTPGKYIQGLVVVDLSGDRCGRRRALVRTLLRAVEANPRRPVTAEAARAHSSSLPENTT